jgi:hypothetical protein
MHSCITLELSNAQRAIISRHFVFSSSNCDRAGVCDRFQPATTNLGFGHDKTK